MSWATEDEHQVSIGREEPYKDSMEEGWVGDGNPDGSWKTEGGASWYLGKSVVKRQDEFDQYRYTKRQIEKDIPRGGDATLDTRIIVYSSDVGARCHDPERNRAKFQVKLDGSKIFEDIWCRAGRYVSGPDKQTCVKTISFTVPESGTLSIMGKLKRDPCRGWGKFWVDNLIVGA